MITREFRVVQKGGEWEAQMRFAAPDEELFQNWILPGWHTFKRSVNRELTLAAVNLARRGN